MANSLKGCLRTSPTLARSASSARMLISDAVAGEGTASSQRRSSACALAGSTHFPHRAPHGASPVFSTCAKLKGTHLKKVRLAKIAPMFSNRIVPSNQIINCFFSLSTGPTMREARSLYWRTRQKETFFYSQHRLQTRAPDASVSSIAPPTPLYGTSSLYFSLLRTLKYTTLEMRAPWPPLLPAPAHRALNNLASRINQSIDIHNIE